MSALVAFEGVLCNDVGEPIPDGLKLYRTLCVTYRVVISSRHDLAWTEHWLKTNYVLDYAQILTSDNFYEGQDLRLRHLQIARQDTNTMELFVDSDPDVCAEVLASNVPTVLFASPKYLPAARKIKPWNALADEQIRQKKRVAEEYAKFLDNDGKNWE